MKRTEKLVFKRYDQRERQLLPPSLDEMIDDTHVVRIVNSMIDRVPLEQLLGRYKGGGTSCYHPGMMLKIIVYAYTQHVYTSRRIAKALRENVHFMWLSGCNKPDFRTIAAFRRDLAGEIQKIFTSTVGMLLEEGYVRFENYFLDGTKIESAANKYTFVWRKAVEKNRGKLEKKLYELFDRIEEENAAEDRMYGDTDLPERGANARITPEMLDAKAKELAEILARHPEKKDLAREAKQIERDYKPRLKRYDGQQEMFRERNSFSKTDPDATFMRLKEDAMMNGQTKPAYNVQIGTENQFIIGYSLHQRPGDTLTMIPHMNLLQSLFGKLPERLIADAGYGSEENLAWLDEQGVDAYVKYNTFDQERRRKFRKNPFRIENLPFDPAQDEFTCPAGKKLVFTRTKRRRYPNGSITETREYQCTSCEGCPLRTSCHRGKGDRQLSINPRGARLKAEAKARLTSAAGIALRRKRSVEVESVFGHIKQCRGFRRFLLKGFEKVGTEWGILAMAHNAIKLAIGLEKAAAKA